MILRIIIGFMIFFLWIAALELMLSLSGVFKEKTKYYSSLSTQSTSDKLEEAAKLLDFIVIEVNIEVENMVRVLALIKQPYNMLKLDEDIKKIATDVFNSLDPELYMNSAFADEDYIFRFIVTETSNRLIENMTNINVKLYATPEK